MNVQNVNFGSHRSEQLKAPSVEKTDKPGVEPAGADGADLKTASVGDRVEISASARGVSQDQDELQREVEFARRAMYSIPPMSPDRAQELLKRLEEGHYEAQDVRMKLSESLAREVVGQAPEAGSETESV